MLYKGYLWFKVTESIKIIVDGKLPRYAMGKDIILKILRDAGAYIVDHLGDIGEVVKKAIAERGIK